MFKKSSKKLIFTLDIPTHRTFDNNHALFIDTSYQIQSNGKQKFLQLSKVNQREWFVWIPKFSPVPKLSSHVIIQ